VLLPLTSRDVRSGLTLCATAASDQGVQLLGNVNGCHEDPARWQLLPSSQSNLAHSDHSLDTHRLWSPFSVQPIIDS
jgi:hypothetical protein